MPGASLNFDIDINVRPEAAFAYVADLTRHGEWSANPLQIAALSPGPPAVGSRFRSTADFNGLRLEADLQITEYRPPSHFAFTGRDPTGAFEHRFTFEPLRGATHVTRQISFTLTLREWLIFQLIYYPVRLPAGRRALRLLKERLEHA